MEVRLLTKTPDDHIVGLCVIDPAREEGVGNRTFSLVMDVYGWASWLWTLTHAPMAFVKIHIINEELLRAQ